MPESITRSEVVYVLGERGSYTVKIGRSIDLKKRLADIQRMSPTPIDLLWSHPGDYELETRLHRHFKALRSHGEWFTFHTDPVPEIAAAVRAQPWLNAVRRPRGRASRDESYLPPDLPPHLATAVSEARDIQDPVASYEAAWTHREVLEAADRQLMEVQRNAVLALRAQGLSWRAIGERLNTTGANVERIATRRKPKK